MVSSVASACFNIFASRPMRVVYCTYNTKLPVDAEMQGFVLHCFLEVLLEDIFVCE